MENIKVNIAIMNREPGRVIRPKDTNYDTFKKWAETKAVNGGNVICEFVESEPVEIEEKPEKKKNLYHMKADELIAELDTYFVEPPKEATRKELIDLLKPLRKNGS